MKCNGFPLEKSGGRQPERTSEFSSTMQVHVHVYAQLLAAQENFGSSHATSANTAG